MLTLHPAPVALLANLLATSLTFALPAAHAQTQPQARAGALAAAPGMASTSAATTAFEGVVEAVRQTVIAAQVPGAVLQLDAKVGDRVKAGQVLLRLDARAADQTATASDAQVQAARAMLEVATKDFERQQQLFQKHYISQAALERAESDLKSTRAQANAQVAQAGAARTQSGFYVVRAPFAGVVAEVPVSLGDMAMPGRPLITLYDPSALRVSAAVPQSLAAVALPGNSVRIELTALNAASAWVTPTRVQLLPTVDAATHTVQLRAELPAGTAGLGPVLVPGMFVRLWLPAAPAQAAGAVPPAARLTVPLAAIVRRAEMTGLYVIDPNGKPVLRQVRLGRTEGDRIQILSGLTAGEPVATDPQAAARTR